MLMILNSQQNCGTEKVAVLQNESSCWQLPYNVKLKNKTGQEGKMCPILSHF